MVKLKRKLFLAHKNWRTLTLVFAGAFLGTGLIFSGINIIGKLVSAAPTVPVPSISLTSQHSSYASDTPGAWNIEKSAKWTSANTARITFEVDTVAKIADNVNYDIIFVADISGSMSGSKLDQVKADASELTESLLSDAGNRIALVSFESAAQIVSGFTSDRNLMLQKINNLSDAGSTNYYDGLVKAEEVLEGYTQQPNRELILLFLTDGYPNADTPNEVGQYELLKAKYPYMIINGIQYEMGTEVLDPIKAVSDYQYIATMNDLNNVLFEASVVPYAYDEFILTDFINDGYFSLGDVNDVRVDKGKVTLSYDGDTPKVTWNLSGLRSGTKAKMTIDITLKDGLYAEDRLYPTNKSTSVETTLADTSGENIMVDNTPVLKNDYDVIYDPNTPSGCVVTGMPATLTEPHRVFETVALTDAEPTCAGYNFTGFDTSDTDVKWLNDDYFIMPEKNVTIRATWTKVSMEKSMDGTVYETKTAIFDGGGTLNSKMKQLAGQSGGNYNTTNTNITAFKRANLLSGDVDINDSAYILSKSDSQAPIYGWFDDNDGTIYYYTDAENVAAYNFRFLFRYMKSLTDISGLADIDTASVTDFYDLFDGAKSISDISALASWDTSSATNMSYAFNDAKALSDISALASWNTSNVTNMRYMFSGTAITSVSVLSGWDTSNVTNMGYMFSSTAISDISALSGWDTSQVTDMSGMFEEANSLSDISALSGWDTSKVTNMRYMFSGTAITSVSVLSGWNTSQVTKMGGMFHNARSLSDVSPLSNWNTSQVTEMAYMFHNASITSVSALSGWDTSQVTDMGNMFCGTAITSVSGLSGWDTSQVTDMIYLFYNAKSLSDISALSGWDTSQVTDMRYMFGLTAITSVSALSGWDTSQVTGMSSMFSGARSLSDISALSGWDTSSVTTMDNMFYSTAITSVSGLSGWDTSQVTNMRYMFYNARSLSDISALSGWNTSSVTDMYGMFYSTGITNVSALSGWNISGVTNMNNMFRNTAIISVSALSGWNTSSVTDMGGMFYDATSLTNISGLSGWNTSQVTNMSYMFYNARSLTDVSALSGWNTSQVTNMSYMFYNDTAVSSFTPLNNWDTSSLTNKTGMFDAINSSVPRPSWY